MILLYLHFVLASAFWNLCVAWFCVCLCVCVSVRECVSLPMQHNLLGHYLFFVVSTLLLLLLLLSLLGCSFPFLRLKNHRQIAFYYHHFSSPLRLLLDPFTCFFFSSFICYIFYPTATPTIKLYILSITICRLPLRFIPKCALT